MVKFQSIVSPGDKRIDLAQELIPLFTAFCSKSFALTSMHGSLMCLISRLSIWIRIRDVFHPFYPPSSVSLTGTECVLCSKYLTFG